MLSLDQNLKLRKTRKKNDYTGTLQLFYARNAARKKLIFRKREDFKICPKWPLCKRYSLCKMLSLDPKLKITKNTQKNDFTSTVQLFYARNGARKQLIFRKREDFKILQKWPLCKDYSLCKMLSLDQKLKLPKTRKKRLYQHSTVVLCKKRSQKTANIPKTRGF